MVRVFLRVLAGFLSAYSFVLFGSIFWRLRLSEESWVDVQRAWLIAWIILEVVTACLKQNPFPRLVTHLRYAPIAIFFFFLATVVAYDQTMILHSKWKIRHYVYGNASPEIPASLELHNNHRAWCGNGYSAAIYGHYADTAAEGFESSESAVRARSLSASIEVHDWLNGVNDGPFPELIRRASNDPDPLVRRIATDFRGESYGFGSE
ncbi:MAG: hypothetical protein ABR568_01590 [Pyrinomonadaceae bacterium]